MLAAVVFIALLRVLEDAEAEGSRMLRRLPLLWFWCSLCAMDGEREVVALVVVEEEEEERRSTSASEAACDRDEETRLNDAAELLESFRESKRTFGPSREDGTVSKCSRDELREAAILHVPQYPPQRLTAAQPLSPQSTDLANLSKSNELLGQRLAALESRFQSAFFAKQEDDSSAKTSVVGDAACTQHFLDGARESECASAGCENKDSRESDDFRKKITDTLSSLQEDLVLLRKRVELQSPQTLQAQQPECEIETASLKASANERADLALVDDAKTLAALLEVKEASAQVRKEMGGTVKQVDGLQSSLKQLQLKTKQAGARTDARIAQLEENAAIRDSALDRIQDQLTHLNRLKKLVEQNMRLHSSTEEIVKGQASMITKHVCVAMREFTARKITENNQLIDATLRARCSEYARNKDVRCVLVREHAAASAASSSASAPSSPSDASSPCNPADPGLILCSPSDEQQSS
mmetsp:Transcript_2656/g.7257  ORF Transcript_2656/g.7257 Transcript_2656/m.7257 type:complete len:469 (+) Transcript_2656:1423-2829(+)